MKKYSRVLSGIMLMTVVFFSAKCMYAQTKKSHAFVDLGLPSGTLWATCNVGANAPEKYGDYFAWGEIQPKEFYYWNNYKHCKGHSDELTKYCITFNSGYNGFVDYLTDLQPVDDAAKANWGGSWRIPTKDQWEELKNNTTQTWKTQNGVKGMLFTASNGNSLFLPTGGFRGEDKRHDVGCGYYWSSSLAGGQIRAYNFYFSSDECDLYNQYRYCGLLVRPVAHSPRQN